MREPRRRAIRGRPTGGDRARRALIASALVALSACHPSARPPAIQVGRECVRCGMSIEDLRFACERQVERGWRQYDSIECLKSDGGNGPAWLADYDSRTLAPAESVWVVEGEFPSPMGGGLAAFRDRAAAEEIASRTQGRVERLAAVAARESTR